MNVFKKAIVLAGILAAGVLTVTLANRPPEKGSGGLAKFSLPHTEVDNDFPPTANSVLARETENVSSDFAIMFPDGDQLEVHIRQTEYKYPTIKVLRDDYDRLGDLALNGDPAIAYYLYKALRNCSNTPYKDEASVESGISQLYQTHTLINDNNEIGSAGITNDRPNDLETMENHIRDEFTYCMGMDNEQLVESEQWRTLAIENGNEMAAAEYSGSLMRGTPEIAAAHLKAFELGDINGAGGVSVAYKNGWPGQAPDLVRAYAYGFIYAELLQANYPRSWQKYADQHLEEISNTIPKYQKESAIEMAKEILRNNPNCCVGDANRLRGENSASEQ